MSLHPHPKRLAVALVGAAALLVVPAAAQADLVVNGKTFSTQEAAPLSRSIVAVFSDDRGAASCNAGAYTSAIDWGDGTAPSPGKVNFQFGGDFALCSFSITGDHRYAHFGVFTTTTSVTGGPLAHSASGAGEITVADVAIEADDRNVTASAGTPFNGEVARFKDVNQFSSPGDFNASIDWGDGTPVTTGVVSGANGDFSVAGTHTYSAAGTFPVRVTFAHPTAVPAVALSTMVVGPAALSPQTVATPTPTVNPTGVFRTLRSSITLRALRRSGLRLQIGVGTTKAKSLTLQVRNSANRAVGSTKLKLAKTGVVTLTWKPSAKLAKKLRAGRTYGLRIRLPGGPTLQTSFRLARAAAR